MPKRPAKNEERASAKEAKVVSKSSLPTEHLQPETEQSRIDRLVVLLDHCTQAKDASDMIGEKFLSYLLAMAIQEGRSAMRQPLSIR